MTEVEVALAEPPKAGGPQKQQESIASLCEGASRSRGLARGVQHNLQTQQAEPEALASLQQMLEQAMPLGLVLDNDTTICALRSAATL